MLLVNYDDNQRHTMLSYNIEGDLYVERLCKIKDVNLNTEEQGTSRRIGFVRAM